MSADGQDVIIESDESIVMIDEDEEGAGDQSSNSQRKTGHRSNNGEISGDRSNPHGDSSDESIVLIDDDSGQTRENSKNSRKITINGRSPNQPIVLNDTTDSPTVYQPIKAQNSSVNNGSTSAQNSSIDHRSMSIQNSTGSRFWLRVLELQPDFAGRTVYFSPSQKSLRCIVNGDGTISPVSSMATRFNSAVRLVDVLKSGKLRTPVDFKMGKGISSTFYSFSQDFFLQPGRRDARVKEFFPAKVAKDLFALEKEQERAGLEILDGFDLNEVQEPISNSECQAGPSNPTDPDGIEDDLNMDGFDLNEFWSVAIKVKPDLVGKTVYFVPTLKKIAPCLVNDDGTFSPQCDPARKYKEAVDMVVDIVHGRLNLGPNGFVALNKSPIMYTCVTDFYMDPTKEMSVLQYLGKFSRCPGIERAKFDSLVNDRRWNAERSESSPVTLEEKYIRSKSCLGVVVGTCLKCPNCKKALDILRGIFKRQQKNPQNASYEYRIKYTGARHLTAEDQAKKNRLQRYEYDKKIRNLKAEASKVDRLRSELEKYKPIHEINRVAIRSLVEYLNAETTRLTSPKCYWMENGGKICGFSAATVADLCGHVNSLHHRSQILANEEIADEENQKFYCYWKGCNRNTRPFSSGHKLHLHLFQHTGSRASVQQLAITRCQLTNMGRAPSARRYNEAVKESILQGRDVLDMTRVIPGLPAPSVQRIRQSMAYQAANKRIRVDRSEEIGRVVETVCRRALGEETDGDGDGNGEEMDNGHEQFGNGETGHSGHVDAGDGEEDDDHDDDMEDDEGDFF